MFLSYIIENEKVQMNLTDFERNFLPRTHYDYISRENKFIPDSERI